jgi:hypothetical protein
MWERLSMILTLALAASACSAMRATEAPISDSACVAFEPLHFSRAAIRAMSDADTAKLEKHNCTGHRICGWPLHEDCPTE